MKFLTSILRHTVTAALVAVCLLLALPTPTFAQVQTFNNSGFYGVSQFKVNGELVASRFNYQVFSQPNSGGGFANFQNFNDGCYMPITSGVRFVPFATNATVKVSDTSNSALTETVALNSVTTNAAPSCVLSLATANSHTGGYVLSSGTCGVAEALNFLGAGVQGTVAITQEFYDQGCTAALVLQGSTIANMSSANQFLHDWTTGQWYQLGPSSLSLTAAPTALTTAGGAAATLTTSTSGGTIATGQAIRATAACVDAIGRESAPATETAATSVVTTGAGSTNSITVVTPGVAGCPNSVGWRPYLSANGGGTLTEILYAPTSAGCTAAPLSAVVTACSLTSNAVVTAIITATAGVPLAGGTATAVRFFPLHTIPSSNPGMPRVYGPFPAITTVTTIQQAAEIPIPAGFFNTGLEKSYRITFSGVGTAAAVTIAGTAKVNIGPRQATGVQTVDTVNFTASTIWPAAGANWTFTTICSTSATGATGTIECQSPTGWIVSTTAAAAPPAFGPQLDATTAPSTALDLTVQNYITLNMTATASSWTTFTVRKVTIEPVL